MAKDRGGVMDEAWIRQRSLKQSDGDRESTRDAVHMAECLQGSWLIVQQGMIMIRDRNVVPRRPIVLRRVLTWRQLLIGADERDGSRQEGRCLDGRTVVGAQSARMIRRRKCG